MYDELIEICKDERQKAKIPCHTVARELGKSDTSIYRFENFKNDDYHILLWYMQNFPKVADYFFNWSKYEFKYECEFIYF